VRKSLKTLGLLVDCQLVFFQNAVVSAIRSDFFIQAVIFHLRLSQILPSGQNIIKPLVKDQYAAYLPESYSVVLITVTMKPVLQEMVYSQVQYVCTHFKSAGIKFSL